MMGRSCQEPCGCDTAAHILDVPMSLELCTMSAIPTICMDFLGFLQPTGMTDRLTPGRMALAKTIGRACVCVCVCVFVLHARMFASDVYACAITNM